MTALQDAEKHLQDRRAALIPAMEAARLSKRALADAIKNYGGPSREQLVREVLATSQADRANGVVARQESVGPSMLDRVRAASAHGSHMGNSRRGPEGQRAYPASQRGIKV